MSEPEVKSGSAQQCFLGGPCIQARAMLPGVSGMVSGICSMAGRPRRRLVLMDGDRRLAIAKFLVLTVNGDYVECYCNSRPNRIHHTFVITVELIIPKQL